MALKSLDFHMGTYLVFSLNIRNRLPINVNDTNYVIQINIIKSIRETEKYYIIDYINTTSITQIIFFQCINTTHYQFSAGSLCSGNEFSFTKIFSRPLFRSFNGQRYPSPTSVPLCGLLFQAQFFLVPLLYEY
jgi:hypothetical protein